MNDGIKNIYRTVDDIGKKTAYIKKVMDSCKTEEQLRNAYNWGISIIWNIYDTIRRTSGRSATYAYLSGIRYIADEKDEEITEHYNDLMGKIAPDNGCRIGGKCIFVYARNTDF